MAIAPSDAGPSSQRVGGQSITRRFHISGLHASTPLSDLQARFSSFGEVLALDRWPPAETGSGEKQKFAYVTIRGNEVALRRCVNVLNGTTWKGGKLKISTAKEGFQERLATERDAAVKAKELAQLAEVPAQPSGAPQQKKRRPKRLPAHIATTAASMEPVDAEKIRTGDEWGWKLTPAGHIVRPMVMRTDHPIAKASSSGKVVASAIKEARNSSKKKKEKPPLVRSRRTVLDPARYGAIHLSGPLLVGDEASVGRDGLITECEEASSPGSEGGPKEVKWVKKDRNGNVISEETARILPARQTNDIETEAAVRDRTMENGNGSSRQEETGEEELLAPASAPPAREMLSSAPSPSSSDSTASESATSEASTPEISGSPLQSRSAELHSFLFDSFDPEAEDSFSDGYEEATGVAMGTEAVSADTDEKKKALSVLGNLFGAEVSVGEVIPEEDQVVPFSAAAEEESEQEHEDGEDEELGDVLVDEEAQVERKATETQVPSAIIDSRARRAALLAGVTISKPSSGFAPIVRFDPRASGQEQEEEEEEEAEDLQQDGLVEADMVDDRPSQQAPQLASDTEAAREDRVRVAKLTDMFRPQAASGGLFGNLAATVEDGDASSSRTAGGFTLFGGLGAELDLEMDEELNFLPDEIDAGLDSAAATPPAPDYDPQPTGLLASSTTRVVGGLRFDPDPELPFFFFGLSEHSRSRREPVRAFMERADAGSYEPFHRHKSDAEIHRRWEERRRDLTAEYKRRHREAVKKKRRRVVGSRAAAGQGGLGVSTLG